MSATISDYDVIIVGAGPAGLAVAACLKQANIESVLLEQSHQAGSAWYRHYDRLHLHTDKKNSELPFLPYPKTYPRFPSRTQVIDYLELYAKTFQLDIRFGQQVVSAAPQDQRWIVETLNSTYVASNLVIAAGYNRKPFLPHWNGRNLFQGKILHSSMYKNGESFRRQNVLVVGFGNSGGEIALDLWEHRVKTSIAIRNAVNVIPRELFGIPILSIGILQNMMSPKLADAINAPILRAVIGDITKYGLRKLPYGPATQIRRDGHIPLIDVGTMRLIREGQLAIYPGIEEFTEEGLKFVDGRQANFDAVVLATGYRPSVDDFLKVPDVLRADGTPSTTGCESPIHGLYFCGYYISPTGMLRAIGIEARKITASIGAKRFEKSKR